jgi:site-specific recombinase
MDDFGLAVAVVFVAIGLVLLLAALIQWGYNDVEMYDVIGGQEIDYEQSLFVALLIAVGLK